MIMFLFSSSILSDLKHPHIVSFQESFYDSEYVYIVQVCILICNEYLNFQTKIKHVMLYS